MTIEINKGDKIDFREPNPVYLYDDDIYDAWWHSDDERMKSEYQYTSDSTIEPGTSILELEDNSRNYRIGIISDIELATYIKYGIIRIINAQVNQKLLDDCANGKPVTMKQVLRAIDESVDHKVSNQYLEVPSGCDSGLQLNYDKALNSCRVAKMISPHLIREFVVSREASVYCLQIHSNETIIVIDNSIKRLSIDDSIGSECINEIREWIRSPIPRTVHVFGGNGLTDATGLFSELHSYSSLDISNMSTENIVRANRMFYGSKIQCLILGNTKWKALKFARQMFAELQVSKLDLSCFNDLCSEANDCDIAKMFDSCSTLMIKTKNQMIRKEFSKAPKLFSKIILEETFDYGVT